MSKNSSSILVVSTITQKEVHLMSEKKAIEIKAEQSGKKHFIMKDFVQTPQDVIRDKQKVTFAERWSRKCGNP